MSSSLLSSDHTQILQPGVVLLPHFFDTAQVYACLQPVLQRAPLRHMTISGGKRMSAAMSNCGDWGWTSSSAGYQYRRDDPLTGEPWPEMPEVLLQLAQQSAALAGFPSFVPDACLINHYAAKAQMGLHQDRDEQDLRQPIVSCSLGLPVDFMLGGLRRSDKVAKVRLHDGDVLIFGGPARLMFHGVKPLAAGWHSITGAARVNLTFRRAN